MTAASPTPATGAAPAALGDRSAAGPAALVGLLAAAVYAVGLSRPSPWRDEVATIDAARRPAAGILALTSHVDAVHAAYYLLVRGVADLDPGPVRVLDGRWISLVGFAVAAAGTVLLGRRTDGARTGLFAGLFLAGSPLASRYAGEARPFALATAVAVVSTLALLAAVRRPGRGRWALYAVTLVALGAVEVLALSLLVAHACWVLVAPGPAGARSRTWRWLAAVGAAVALLSPLLAVVLGQRGQIGALGTPTPRDLAAYAARAAGSVAGSVVLAAAGAAFLVLGWRQRRATQRTIRSGRTVSTGWLPVVVWGVGLPVLIWVVSQVDPLFRDRYVLFTLPGLALLAGGVLARLPVPVAAVTVAAVVVAGLPTQVAIRQAGGHGEDIRALDAAVAALRRPGDAVVFVPRSTARVAQLDPRVWAGTTNLTDNPALIGSAARPTSRVLLVQRVSGADSGPSATDSAAVRAVERSRRPTDRVAVTGFVVTVYTAR